MQRKLLWAMIAILIMTNIATLILWQQDETVSLDHNNNQINQRDPVASVGNGTISYNEWMLTLRESHGKRQLKSMMNQRVVRQLAEENNVTIDDKIIAREVAQLTTMQGVMTKEETKNKEEQWRKDIQYRYLLEALLTADIDIPDEKVKNYYEDYKRQYDFKASSQVSHIVVSNMKTASRVISELEEGASFNLLAQEYSIDEETRDNGGYLGFLVNTSQFWPEGYLDKIKNMAERSFSDPFETNAGIAIVYLHRKLPSVTFNYDEIKPYVERELAINQMNQPLSAEVLWDELETNWIYDE
ncbi:foldase protein PrsA 2 [Lentibacillus kapialis]|uniref:peptidylprolyl isomerase n=1 Tax=Lentibacillus kapialis TaxID=340214 RepID=A0A917UZ06_9BACI|nr:peptidyl-prolyl cis-trans isomerase [Lentibacillus kapialis]GGK01218.1 foldase protein PrsA 2 [Lentibacillus kapialis]